MYLCSPSPPGTLRSSLLFKWSSLKWGVLAREPFSTTEILLKLSPNLQQQRENKGIQHTRTPSHRHVINQVTKKDIFQFCIYSSLCFQCFFPNLLNLDKAQFFLRFQLRVTLFKIPLIVADSIGTLVSAQIPSILLSLFCKTQGRDCVLVCLSLSKVTV